MGAGAGCWWVAAISHATSTHPHLVASPPSGCPGPSWWRIPAARSGCCVLGAGRASRGRAGVALTCASFSPVSGRPGHRHTDHQHTTQGELGRALVLHGVSDCAKWCQGTEAREVVCRRAAQQRRSSAPASSPERAARSGGHLEWISAKTRLRGPDAAPCMRPLMHLGCTHASCSGVWRCSSYRRSLDVSVGVGCGGLSCSSRACDNHKRKPHGACTPALLSDQPPTGLPAQPACATGRPLVLKRVGRGNTPGMAFHSLAHMCQQSLP